MNKQRQKLGHAVLLPIKTWPVDLFLRARLQSVQPGGGLDGQGPISGYWEYFNIEQADRGALQAIGNFY